jgi:8-amino-7-oxononanoate synthase
MTSARLTQRSMAWVDDELMGIRAGGLERRLLELTSAPGPTVELDGRRYLLLGSNNYLDLAAHPEVVAGAVAAAQRYGAGSSGSRLVSGSIDLQRRLEERLAEMVDAEAVLLFSSGYLANVSTIAALVGRGDVVFSDALNHASIIDGCKLSGAAVSVFPHADMDALDSLLKGTPGRRRLIVSDSIFSMEADSAPLERLAELAGRHEAILMLDESHALGILGERAGGLAQARGVRPEVLMGTLSKAIGSAGGFIAGSSRLVEFLRHRARGFIFDTAPAPATVGAALASLEVIAREPGRRERVLKSSLRLGRGLREAGLHAAAGEAVIVPLMVGEPGAAVALAARLRDAGVIAPAIRPPSVPAGTSRLRLTVSAGFSEAQVDMAMAAIIEASR